MINIMIVDDSMYMRKMLKDMIKEESNIKVLKEAKNGEEAIQLMSEEIDVVILDVEMPKKNGLEVLRHWKKVGEKANVIMFSSLTKKGADETVKALELGAFDFLQKPSTPLSIKSVKSDLIKLINTAGKLNKVKDFGRDIKTIKQGSNQENRSYHITELRKVENLILIGCSTGGPNALRYLLSKLDKDLNASIIVAQHMPGGAFIKSLIKSLNQVTNLNVSEAISGTEIKNGNVYICTSGLQTYVDKLGVIQTKDIGIESGHAPSVNYLFRETLKRQNSVNIIPVVLTGMGEDGAKSSLLYSERSIETIVESEKTSAVFGMPRKVIEFGAKHRKLELTEIPGELYIRTK